MTIAAFKVFGRLGFAGGSREGSLTIDRKSGKVTVRAKKSHTVHEMSINKVADYVCTYGAPAKTERKKGDGQPEGG